MPEQVEAYTALAVLYDKLMADVDYEMWADFIDELMQTHHPNPVDVLELACGTGSLSLSLTELECYNLTATDRSEAMIHIARQKALKQNAEVDFQTLDFLNIDIDQTFDIIFSVFDSVNYLHSENDILAMLRGCLKILNPGGLLIFDFSTPQNSLEAVDYLNNEEGSAGEYRFFRESKYDAGEQFHYNIFDIEKLADDGKTVIERYQEVHKQRIYSLNEMLSIVDQTPYHPVAGYEDFDLIEANENSARVTMVLCRNQQ